jgi:hypothetical protein
MDPGISPEDLTEADLDIEWAGAIAPKAQIIYVNAFSAVDSLQYAVEQNVAPVISVSYGDCERNFAGELQMLTSLGQQANAQGTTIVSASGDNGAADCEAFNATIATQGLAVDMPASLPYVTALGGTEFQDTASNWGATNNSSSGSALGYISEIVWNDSNSSGLAATGGGKSKYFSKPSWQTGAGVPNDSARDVPDISFSASADHDGYLICSGGSCVNGYRNTATTLDVVGGTSAAAPSFAGVLALINQSTGSSQGNVNPNLYRIAAAVPAAFHDITVGGNQVSCRIGTPDCTTGRMGYAAGPGYDLVTGLGTVDAAVLLSAWSPSSTTTSSSGSSGTTTDGGTGSTSTGTGSSTPPGPPVPQPISVVEQGSIQSGYVTITPDSSSGSPTPTVTYGIVSNAVVVAQAGVTPTNMMTDGSLYADVIPGIGRNLGVALANLNAGANSVTLTLRDANGNALANPVTISLNPQQQMARFVNELFPSTALGSSFLGSLRVQSSFPLGVLGLRFNGAQFSTLPVAVNATTSNNSSFVLPQFAMGGGWATQVALVNNTGSPISGVVRVYDTSGNPLAVTLNGSTQTSFSYSIPAGGTFVLAPRDANGQSPF